MFLTMMSHRQYNKELHITLLFATQVQKLFLYWLSKHLLPRNKPHLLNALAR
jgi:hypothetical protein